MKSTNFVPFTLCFLVGCTGVLFTKKLIFDVLIKLLLNQIFSFLVFLFTLKVIPKCTKAFIDAKLSGIDVGKIDKRIIPESLGIVCGAFYLVTVVIYIPFKYLKIGFDFYDLKLIGNIKLLYPLLKDSQFDQNELNIMLAALLAICCMLMLGFVDDVLNLRWRQKLIFPFIASLPILIAYFINYNVTSIMLPKPWHFAVDLGIFYYFYMFMVVIFCTNSINIMAGINGLEVGQSVLIAISILIFNIIELNGDLWKAHFISFILILPFFCISMALLVFNWYPAQVFVGDTYCYFAGMTFAVVGILGHFSKTMMLFFLPQIFNFLFSLPQLFHLLPCPRHRLPKYDNLNDVMGFSTFKYRKSELSRLSKFILWIYIKFNLVKIELVSLSVDTFEVSNCTIINFILYWYGPMKEEKLTQTLLLIQILSSCLAFFIRYYLSYIFY